MSEMEYYPGRRLNRGRNVTPTVVIKPCRAVPAKAKTDAHLHLLETQCLEDEASRPVVPPLVQLRELHADNLAYAGAIMQLEGRCSSIRVHGVEHKRLDGRNATPFQWLSEANKVLAREGLPPIGRVGGWN